MSTKESPKKKQATYHHKSYLTWKTLPTVLFTIFCVALNCLGHLLVHTVDFLPFKAVWFDSLGTIFCAYVTGPLGGAIVGGTSNFISSMFDFSSVNYAPTSIVIGIVVGLICRKSPVDRLPGMMQAAFVTAIVSAAVSTPINMLTNDGMVGTVVGDGVIEFFKELAFPQLLSCFLGQLYMDFGDKLITLLILYLSIHLFRMIAPRVLKKRRGTEEEKQTAASAPADGHPAAATAAVSALLVCLLAVPAPAPAEGTQADYNDYVQTVYSSHNGLPCGEANDIAMTNDGVLWIGTYAGLYRYNGREFRWVDYYDSVRNVNCLYVDHEGRLWIGTNDMGLSIAIRENIVNVLDSSTGLPSDSVRSIIESSDGYYYVGTTSGMQILQMNDGLKRLSTLSEVHYADNITADGDGHVAAIASDGRIFLMQRGRILSSLRLLSDTEVFNCCAFDEDDRLLVGTSSNHIYIYDISDGSFRETEVITCEGVSSINNLNFLDESTIFVSTDSGVGYLDQAKTFHPVNTNSFNNSIDNMIVDYQGNLWFTSSRLGLLRLAPSAFRDVYGTIGMDRRVVNTVVFWQGSYLIGTDKGLDIVDESCRHQIRNDLTELFQGQRIRCMMVDSFDHLWVCSYSNGLTEIAPDLTSWHYNADSGSFGNRARMVTQLRDGTVLAAGDTGISYISDHEILKTIRYEDGLINSMILTLTEMDDGTILAGTDGDGIAVLRDRKVESMLTRDDGLPSGVILRTVLDPKGNGVFVVTSNSLCYLEPDGTIRTFDAFPYFNNYDVFPRDENTLMVMSSAGIYVVDRDELMAGGEISWELLDAKSGLNSALTANSWNWCSENGDLFLPCDTGVYIIDTHNFDSSARNYRISMSGIRLDNEVQPLRRTDSLTVSRDVSRIELFPEILNYTIRDPMVAYMLDGFDEDWTTVSQSELTSVSYTNLSAGTYTFRLRVLGNDDGGEDRYLGSLDYTLVKKSEIYDSPLFLWYIVILMILFFVWGSGIFMTKRIQKAEQKTQMEKARRREAEKQARQATNIILSIATLVDAKDGLTSNHSKRVANYSRMLGEKLGFSEKECNNLFNAALLHDIGKVGIPDSILNKDSRLTDEEYATMKSHVVTGGKVLASFDMIPHVMEGAKYHHERYDGRGYPDHLKGEEIPEYGRIIGVCDAFDAMTANRVYRGQMDWDYVLSELKKGRGTQFDPNFVDAFLELIDEGKIDLKGIYQNHGADLEKYTQKTFEENIRRQRETAVMLATDEEKGGSRK
ncbi:MAG: HD domain-containing protein [Clostridia bacterium]|nr:HD domain-containing protein [Clostridia bacterium]